MDNQPARDFESDDTAALSAYWDAVARGDENPPINGLDPDTVALVRQVGNTSRSKVPATARDRALAAAMRELTGHKAHSNGHERRSNMTTATLPSRHPSSNSTTRRSDRRYAAGVSRTMPDMSRVRMKWIASLAAVAVLLIAFFNDSSIIRSGLPGSDNGRLNSIPAVQISPEPSSPDGIPFRTLIIPAEYLPAGEIKIRTMEFNIAPGSESSFSQIDDTVSIEIVSIGSYGVTSDGPRLIWRGGSDAPPEEIAPGAEGIVEPGDTIAYLDNSPQTVRVIGDEYVSAFFIGFVSEIGNTDEIGATEDATVAVRQVTLEPGASISWPGEASVERYVESGVLTFEVSRTGESTPQGSLTFSDIVRATTFPPEITVVLRNDGSEPVIFLEAVVTLPTDAGTPPAGTPTS